MTSLGARAVSKSFGGRPALDGVTFEVHSGEVAGLLGENGAGKTTLLRVLAGFLAPDAGHVALDGAEVRLAGPRDAAARGIGLVHQDFLLIPELTVTENVVLGREPGGGPLYDAAAAEREVRECAARFGLGVDPRAKVGDLGVAAQQRVELLKVLVRGARWLLLDEPTALLPPEGARELFALVRRLAAEGCGVVFVTHRLREVREICGRAVVLRRGRVTGERDVAQATEQELARLMVGEDLALAAPGRGARGRAGDRGGEVLLRVRDVVVRGRGGRPLVDRVSLELRAGEVVGIAGVAGNGQVELLEAIVGLREASAAEMSLGGSDLRPLDVGERRRAGLGYVPEDRLRDGVVPQLTVEENLAATANRLGGFAARGWLDRTRMRREGEEAARDHDVRPPDPQALAGALSGGNQQKVLVAREIRAAPRVLLAVEPARGLDFRATDAVHGRLRGVAAAGGAVLLVDTDLAALLALCDRVLVMFGGAVAGEVDPAHASEEELGLLISGARAR